MGRIKTKEEIEILREGGSRLSVILSKVAEMVKPGITTEDLDAYAERLIREGGDKPAFLYYKPDFSHKHFPSSLCVSVNDEVVHGIPGKRVLEEGDIVGLDLGLAHKDLYTDMALTVAVGKVDDTSLKLMDVTKQSLASTLMVVRDGARLGDIGAAVEGVVGPSGFGIVHELGGHGVGHAIHEPPFIAHFGTAGKGEKLETGMVIAIEPMINTGSSEVNFDTGDGYTVRTSDGSRSAHFEVTLAVTQNGAEVLTPIFW
ncbi:MAG TPA: type I methionyl aminopeptidase [Candidatus Paceibacterota bacterium]